MEAITQPTNLLDRFNKWIQESIMIKLFSIGILILILLIPSGSIQDLIEERQSRAGEVIQEVAEKWSGSQSISGPVLVVPYRKHEIIDRGKDGKEIREHIEKAFFLPEDLTINGNVNPEILHRGIFDAVVYESSLSIAANFNKPDFKKLSIPEDMVLWNGAYITYGITDLRGISDNPILTLADKPFTLEPSNNIGFTVRGRQDENLAALYKPKENLPSSSGIVAKLNWDNADAFVGQVSMKLKLKGSNRLDFVPLGKTTSVKLQGPWPDPSFDGQFLPASREITNEGFTAAWKILHFNRAFSQQWADSNQELSGADFGVKLLIPVDQYQKSMRTSKYGVLVILLTFIALFLVEIIQKVRIHPFQYILIGVALIIYYTLLLSFSEHVGYNIAYIISSIATVILVSLYSTTFLPSKKLSLVFSLLLITFYSFIFIIILQQDFSLLLGSLGLFLIVSLLMYFSRKIKWYREAVA
ncbi:cell envelope integrity protein CreD [Chryseolinea sp. H1M3-3]|uniref:cell envelope integrity protein CreD n=1 Tax=Chryseolinea sp. H1M3-3 TaxID=3034144 RepID=UPI0023EE0101|nr:cell envelope integrity protein CreD [Chryseolinea sp. H1M3-3]